MSEARASIRNLRVVGIYAACAVFWILISDNALLLLTGDTAPSDVIGALKGWLFVAVSSLALYVALWRETGYPVHPEGGADLGGSRGVSWNLVAAFLLVSSILVMIGRSVYTAMDNTIISQENERIGAIADFKKDQITAWLSERQGEILGYMDSSYFADALERAQARKGREEIGNQLSSHLEALLRSHKYIGTELLDSAEQLVASAGESAVRDDRFRHALLAARSSLAPVFLDLARAAPSAPIRLGFVLAIRDPRQPDRPVVGFAAFTVDPSQTLFPMLGAWPTDSRSGETLLVRRDGADVVFLTPLRYGNNTPLGLSVPLTRSDLPAAMAVTRGAGTYEGTDYRGVAVTTAFRAVPGTPWLVGSKIDQDEAYSSSRTVLLVCVLLIGTGTVIAGAMLAMVWRHQRLRDRFRHLALQDQLAKVAASAPGLVCSFRLRPDGSAAMPIAGPASLDLFGLTPEQVAEDATPIFNGMPPEDAERVLASVRASAQTMEPWHDEYRFRHPLKGERWIEGHSVPKREADGSILWHGYVHDITDRKRAEIDLLTARDRILENEARLQLVQSAADLGWWDWVVETGEQTWSPANYRLHGIDPGAEPVTYGIWLAAVHPDDRDRAAAVAAVAVALGGAYETDYRVILPDGTARWLIGRGRLVTDAVGTTRRMLGVSFDITQLKRVEADLARANNLLRARNLGNVALLQAADEFSYLRAACGIVVEACGHTMMWVGYADPGLERRVVPVAVAGLDAGYLDGIRITWADDEYGQGPTGSAIRTGQPVVCTDMLTDSRIGPWRAKVEQQGYRSSLAVPLIGENETFGALTIYSTQVGSFDEGEVGLLSEIANDIARGVSVLRLRAAHARTERALRDSEAQLRIFIEHAPAALAMVDADMRYLFASSRWLADYHLDVRDVVGKSHYEVFPEIPERWKEIHRRCLAGAVERCEEDAFVRLDGQTDWLRWAIHPWYGDDGSVGGIVMMSEDITEKKHAQEELERYRVHLEELVAERTKQLAETSRLAEARAAEVADLYDHAPCGYHSLDTTGLILRINDTELSWLGYRREEVVGRMRFSDLLDERGKAAFKRNFRQFLATGYLYDREYELFCKGGAAIPVLISATATRDKSGAIVTTRSVVYNIADLKAVEKAAAYHARLADAFFSHSIACLVVLDRDYNFLRVNEAYARACRRDIDDFNGRNHFEMYPSDTQAIFDDVVRSKRSFETFTRAFVFPDQPERGMTYWDWTLVPILDQAGEVEYLVFSLNEVTERKRAEEALRESESKYRMLFDRSPDGIVLIDPETTCPIEFNEIAHTALGYSREEFARLRLADISTVRPKEVIAQRTAIILRDGGDDFETLHQTRDGQLRNRAISVRMLELDGRKLLHAIWHDITALKQAEEELRRHRDNLEGLVSERTTALTESNRLLEAANRAKSAFLANMSHELRTPLGAILGFSQLLEMDIGTVGGSADAELCVGQILKNGRYLLALINDLLDMAKIDAGQISISLEPTDVAGLLLDFEAMIVPLAEPAAIEIAMSCDDGLPAVMADRTRLSQVLLNLGSNAVKYNHPGGRVDVSCMRLDADWVRLSIADTGPGIPEDRRHEAFEPFNRLGREASAVEGTGIGLALSRRLMALMGGRIDFSSVPGRGSTFWIDIGVHVSDAGTCVEVVGNGGGEEGEKERSGVSGTVLCVDDNRSVLDLVSMALKSMANISLLTALTAEQGLDLARTLRPDVILLDINLPGMDGFAALEVLLGQEETKDIPVFALSAAATQADIEKGQAVGFRRYLTKPFDVRELRSTVAAVLAEKQSGGVALDGTG